MDERKEDVLEMTNEEHRVGYGELIIEMVHKRDSYTTTIVNCLTSVSQKSREQILKEWEKEIFPRNEDVKKFIKHIYDNVVCENNKSNSCVC